MENNFEEDYKPDVKPLAEGERPKLNLRKEGVAAANDKKACPHCDRVIEPDAIICPLCGYNLKKKRTRQEIERRNDFSFKPFIIIGVLIALSVTAFIFRDNVSKFFSDVADDEKRGQMIESVKEGARGFSDAVKEKMAAEEEEKTITEELENEELEAKKIEIQDQIEGYKSEIESYKENVLEKTKEYDAFLINYNGIDKKYKAAVSQYNKLKASGAKKANLERSRERARDFSVERKEISNQLKDYAAEKSAAEMELKNAEKEVSILKKKLANLGKKNASEATVEEVTGVIETATSENGLIEETEAEVEIEIEE